MIMYLMYCTYIHTYVCAFKRTIRWGKKNKEQEKKRKKRKKRETGSFSVSLALFFLPKIIRVILESGFAYFFFLFLFFFLGGRRVLVLAVPPRLCYQLKVTPPPKKKSPIDLASRLSRSMRTFAM